VTDGLDPDFADFAAAQARGRPGFPHALAANPHDAWDLTQETLARMGERWGRTRLEEPAAYARTVMVRLDIDRLRRLRRELR
jgi:DNA-directed RNA polymerase specialized sigma24 family protein